MHLLAKSFPELKIFGATVPQSTALGAALAISENTNINLKNNRLIELSEYE